MMIYDSAVAAEKDPRCKNMGTFIHSGLSEDFLTHELVDLATGSEEKIMRITSRFGPLISPYLYDAHKRISECAKYAIMCEIYGKNNIPLRHELAKALEKHDAEIVRALAYENMGGSSDAAYSIKRIMASLISKRVLIRGLIVSFDEIRGVASMLLASVAAVEGMASGKPAVEIIEDSGGLGCLNYIGECLKNIGRAPRYIMIDETGRETDTRNLLGSYLWEELPEGIKDEALFAYKNSFNGSSSGTLTEAVAAMIKNIAESGRTWDYCAHCGRLFPLRPGQTRDRRGEYRLYCSPRCKNAGAQKRNREKRKEQTETNDNKREAMKGRNRL
jgi:hypothetical protein